MSILIFIGIPSKTSNSVPGGENIFNYDVRNWKFNNLEMTNTSAISTASMDSSQYARLKRWLILSKKKKRALHIVGTQPETSNFIHDAASSLRSELIASTPYIENILFSHVF